jgi:mono/diheme cytochrome c family protein
MFRIALFCVLSLGLCGGAVAGDAAAGKAKVDAVCSKCHEKEDWSEEDAASLQGKIKGVVDGKAKHKEKLSLTDAEIADIAAYWTGK